MTTQVGWLLSCRQDLPKYMQALAATVDNGFYQCFAFCCAGQPLSKWLVGHKMGKNVDPAETRAVFVVSL